MTGAERRETHTREKAYHALTTRWEAIKGAQCVFTLGCLSLTSAWVHACVRAGRLRPLLVCFFLQVKPFKVTYQYQCFCGFISSKLADLWGRLLKICSTKVINVGRGARSTYGSVKGDKSLERNRVKPPRILILTDAAATKTPIRTRWNDVLWQTRASTGFLHQLCAYACAMRIMQKKKTQKTPQAVLFRFSYTAN